MSSSYSNRLFQEILSKEVPKNFSASFPPRPNGGCRMTIFRQNAKSTTQVLDVYYDCFAMDTQPGRRLKLMHHASIYVGSAADIDKNSSWSTKSYLTEESQRRVLRKLAKHLISRALLESI